MLQEGRFPRGHETRRQKRLVRKGSHSRAAALNVQEGVSWLARRMLDVVREMTEVFEQPNTSDTLRLNFEKMTGWGPRACSALCFSLALCNPRLFCRLRCRAGQAAGFLVWRLRAPKCQSPSQPLPVSGLLSDSDKGSARSAAQTQDLHRSLEAHSLSLVVESASACGTLAQWCLLRIPGSRQLLSYQR